MLGGDDRQTGIKGPRIALPLAREHTGELLTLQDQDDEDITFWFAREIHLLGVEVATEIAARSAYADVGEPAFDEADQFADVRALQQLHPITGRRRYFAHHFSCADPTHR